MKLTWIYKLGLAVLMTQPSSASYAQESKDSIDNIPNYGKVEISKEELQQLWKDQETLKENLKTIEFLNASLSQERHRADSLNTLLASLSAQLQEVSKERDGLKKESESIKDKPVAADKHLIDMAANFLFIPYEQYSIDQIAIPAFGFVQSEALRREYGDRLEILESYRKDLFMLAEFLKHPGLGMNKISAGSSLDKLKRLSVYSRYHKYDWLNGSYLYTKISEIEKKLTNVVKTGTKEDFSGILDDLERCIKTITDQ
ncbi:hypothetical protein [uncultured Bacteroides sp.]|uniref:hypothetical protein n=1 Tax=uncultured Bacteroides sp. TaxID=162156 RepID=UPI0026130EC4|nr:hypothetical protein [uncultured Bacteroides sp.]